ncbi:RCC1 domain-containing protein [Enhygromyxa salina]|uniref:RCC1 domain-containing protein n=1 Tax=Enhygromyxa salina TaxID=215803 RepID=UPI0015E5FC13|nr:hypothetical protein [Enhygromyxa salina]
MCAHRSDDVPTCWGGRAHYEIIGDDEPASEGRLDPPSLPFEHLEVVGNACGLYKGNVYCWGRDHGDGRLGYGFGDSEITLEQALERGGVAIGEPIIALDSGASSHIGTSQVCALGESGDVYCWGFGSNLGYPGIMIVGDDETPAQIGPVELGGRAVAIDTGGAGTCAMLDDGALRCWGNASLAGGVKIGDDEDPADGPLIELGATIHAVSVGDGHACAIVGDGEVKCWGFDPFGALGRPGIAGASPSASLEPVEIGGRAVEIVAQVESSCARLEGGEIMCWGSGSYGKMGHPWHPSCEVYGPAFYSCSADPSCCIGDDETPLAAGPVDLPEPARDLVGLSAGACILAESGGVVCWGGSFFGLLGDGMAPACSAGLEIGPSCLVDPRCCIGDDETPTQAGERAWVPLD